MTDQFLGGGGILTFTNYFETGLSCNTGTSKIDKDLPCGYKFIIIYISFEKFDKDPDKNVKFDQFLPIIISPQCNYFISIDTL